MNTFKIAAIATVSALALTSAAQAQDKLKIGLLTTLSGPAAALGIQQRNGFELALKNMGNKLGGRDVELIVQDDELKPDVAVSKAKAMVERDKVDFVVGPIFSNILTTQANVTRQSDATVRGQQFASSIEEAMRNAVEFKTDGSSLVVETSINGVVECRTFSAATAGVRVDALTFTYVDSTGGVTGSPVSGVRYSFSSMGGPTSDGTTPGAAPPVFKGDAFARNTQTEADPTC